MAHLFFVEFVAEVQMNLPTFPGLEHLVASMFSINIQIMYGGERGTFWDPTKKYGVVDLTNLSALCLHAWMLKSHMYPSGPGTEKSREKPPLMPFSDATGTMRGGL